MFRSIKLGRRGKLSFYVFIGALLLAFLVEKVKLVKSQSLPLDEIVCEANKYNTRVILYDPLIIHLENFLTVRERDHLQNLA
jgi:hypothetical protein